MQTSTVWRWNRAVYDVADGAPHLRIENRVLPAGPTLADVMANAALFYGAVAHLAQHGPEPPLGARDRGGRRLRPLRARLPVRHHHLARRRAHRACER